MNSLRLIAGFAFSILAGHIVLWSLIEKCLWPYVRRNHLPDAEHHKSRLSWLVGILDAGHLHWRADGVRQWNLTDRGFSGGEGCGAMAWLFGPARHRG